jgi:hypothetical protein
MASVKSTAPSKARSRKPARRKPAPKPPSRSRRGRWPGHQLPDLSAILFAFRDAQALMTVAHAVVVRSYHYGPEERVLRMGVDALQAVYRQLEEADLQLARFQKKNARALRGAS